MQARYRIAWDVTGWAVIDMTSDQLAEFNTRPLIGLLPEDAENICSMLNANLTPSVRQFG